MMSFKDMTFCDSNCSNIACGRNFSPAQKVAADKWWGKEGAPISISPSYRVNCDDYVAPVARIIP